MNKKPIYTAIDNAPNHVGEVSERYKKKVKRIVKIVKQKINPDSKVISIGAGACILEVILSIEGYDVKAIDKPEHDWAFNYPLKEKQKYAEEFGVDLSINDADELDVGRDEYDCCLMVDVIEHIKISPRQILNSSIGSLRSGGLLVIQTPNFVHLKNRLEMMVGKSPQTDLKKYFFSVSYGGHIREYTPSELKLLLSEYINMQNVKVKTINNFTHKYESSLTERVVKNMYVLLAKVFPSFKDSIICTSRKPSDWEPKRVSVENVSSYKVSKSRFNADEIYERMSYI